MFTGSNSDVINVRGTSANGSIGATPGGTYIITGGGNDTVFVSSDAALANQAEAWAAQYLPGVLDYVDAPLYLSFLAGPDQRLLISDADHLPQGRNLV